MVIIRRFLFIQLGVNDACNYPISATKHILAFIFDKYHPCTAYLTISFLADRLVGIVPSDIDENKAQSERLARFKLMAV